MDGLTPGRVVHFVAERKTTGLFATTHVFTRTGDHVAATVTRVDASVEGRVWLSVAYPGQAAPEVALADYDAAGLTPGTWHWIERA